MTGAAPLPTADLAASDDLRFDALVATYVDAPGFVARPWLNELVDERLARPECRYLMLTGETGSGKTAFMAALARARPAWLRYFIRADSMTPLSGGDTVSVMLRIGHQLAALEPKAFDPELLELVVKQRVGEAGTSADVAGVRIGDLRVSPFYRTAIHVEQDVQALGGRLTGIEIGQATLEPRILEPATLSHMALLDPVAALARRDPVRTVVVMIDALDEVATLAGGSSVLDWLESGPALPANLRIVLTSRPGAHLDAFRAARGNAIGEIALDHRSARVLGDVRVFAARLFGAIDASHPGTIADGERAVAALAAAAQGNFAYLTAYERALQTALATGDAESVAELLSFKALPGGLQPLYASFIARLRRQVDRLGLLDVAKPRSPEDDLAPAWSGVAQRLLGVLAVARASVTLAQMMALGGVRVVASGAGEVLRCLLPLLDEAGGAYSLFHGSFRDYLTEQPDALIDPDEWHQRIVAFYAGDKAWNEIDWTAIDDYGLRHAVEHVWATAAPAADLTGLLTRSLRAASSARFRSDLPFRRNVELIRARSANADTAARTMTDAIFCELLVAGLTASAMLAPAVFGLMARLGRAREALDRAEVIPPGIDKLRAMQAIRACTPVADRELLGPNDGAELLVAVAYATPEVSATNPFGGDAVECLGDAAVAIAAHDLERALRLIARRDALRRYEPASDDVMNAVVRAAPADRARSLLDRLGEEAALVAIDFAERADTIAERADWIALANARLAALSAPEQIWQQARVVALEARDGVVSPAQLDPIRDLFATRDEQDGFGSGGGYALSEAATLLRPLDAALAEMLLASVEVLDGDGLSDFELRRAAEVRVSWGQPERARVLIDRVLKEYRSRGWWGPAEYIAMVARIVATFDPAWSTTLADEAEAMVEPILRDPRLDEDRRLDGVLARMVEAFRHLDPPRAFRLARRCESGRAPQAAWDSAEGRGGVALLGLDLADSDPDGALAVLDECLGSAGRQGRFGRAGMVADHAGLFRLEDGRAPGESGLAMASSMNYANYWRDGREWRVFGEPADVLRSVASVFPSGASWGQAVAGALEAAARVDAEGALALAGRLGDPSDRLIALAGIVEALVVADDEERLGAVAALIIPTAEAQPIYRPDLSLDEHPLGAVFQYLDPTARARFEAAMILAPHGGQLARALIDASGSMYLSLVWQAGTAVQNHIERLAAGEAITPEERDEFLETMRGVAERDPLLADVARCTLARWGGLVDPALGGAIAAEIDDPGYRLIAEKADVAGPFAAGISPLKVATLATRWMVERPDDETRAHARAAGINALADADPLSRVVGLIMLASAVPEESAALLDRALRESDDVANVYLRAEALGDLMLVAIWADNRALLAQLIGRMAQTGWWQLAGVLRGCLPALASDGVGMIEAIDDAIRHAAAVLERGPAEHEHLDGVRPRSAGIDLLAPAAELPPPTPEQLALYLDAADLPPTLRPVQDERASRPDPDDDQFEALGGLHTGFRVWMAGDDQPLWRLVDIRFVFPDEAAAAAYHARRLDQNSEGAPSLPDAAPVGEECHVFGGAVPIDVGGTPFEMTHYFHVFRVGSVVAKLYSLQGTRSPTPLLLEQVTPIARRVVDRITTMPAPGSDSRRP